MNIFLVFIKQGIMKTSVEGNDLVSENMSYGDYVPF